MSAALEACSLVNCELCARPIPPEEPAVPSEYLFICAWKVPQGRHRFVLSRTTPHDFNHLNLAWGSGGALRLAAARMRGCDLLVAPMELGSRRGRVSLPFGLRVDVDNSITFVVYNAGPAPTLLTVGFDLVKLT